MTTAFTLDRLKNLKIGDHLCLMYEAQDNHAILLKSFLQQGLECGEKVLYLSDTTSEGSIPDSSGNGISKMDTYAASGQLDVRPVEQIYLCNGIFNPDAVIERLRQETHIALGEGYSALRVTGEMTWALRGLPGSERLIEYEAKLNDFLSHHRCTLLCQYDRRRFSPSILLHVLATHPNAVVESEIRTNSYYMIPPVRLIRNSARITLCHWLNQLAGRNFSQMASFR